MDKYDFQKTKQQQYKATQYWHRPSTLKCSKIKQTNQTYQTSAAKQLVEIGIGKKKKASQVLEEASTTSIFFFLAKFIQISFQITMIPNSVASRSL